MRIALLLLLLLVPFVAAEECLSEKAVLREGLKAEHLFLKYRAEIRLVGMNTAIEALHATIDTTVLETIRDEFVFTIAHAEDAIALADPDLLSERVVELDTQILTFRAGVPVADLKNLRQLVHDALAEQDDHLTAFRNQAFSARKRLFLKEFDRTLCVYHTVVSGLDEHQYNIDKLEDRVRSISDLRPKLEAAIDDAHRSCQSTPLFKCSRDDVDDMLSIQRHIQDGFRRVRDDIVETGVRDRQRIALQNLRADIENFADDLDTPDEEVDELLEHLGDAEERFAEEQFDVVDDLLNDLARDFTELREDHGVRV